MPCTLAPNERTIPMQFTIQPSQFVSRLIALLAVAFPLALIIQEASAEERRLATQLSHQELITYLQSGYEPSLGVNYLSVALFGLVVVVLIEVIAFVLRLILRAILTPTTRLAMAR